MELRGTITEEAINVSSDLETDADKNSDSNKIEAELIPLNDRWEFDPVEYPALWKFQLTGSSLPAETELACEKAFRDAASKWHHEHVHLGQSLDLIDSGIHYLYGCHVKSIRGNATVFLASTRVNLVSGRAHLIDVSAKSYLQNVCGHCHIDKLYGMSHVSFIFGNSHIGRLTDGASVDTLSGYASIDIVSDNSCVRTVENNSKIMCACENARIINLNDEASVYVLKDNARIGWPMSMENPSEKCEINIINL